MARAGVGASTWLRYWSAQWASACFPAGCPFAWLAIALLVMLVATALTTLTDALAADVARAGDVVGFMTRYSIVQDLGAALGPALAFLLLERPGGFAWLYWGGSLAFLVLALLWLRRGDSQTGLLTIR